MKELHGSSEYGTVYVLNAKISVKERKGQSSVRPQRLYLEINVFRAYLEGPPISRQLFFLW